MMFDLRKCSSNQYPQKMEGKESIM